VLAGAGGLACSVGDAFLCASDQQCGSDGLCESSGFCSFPDATCESGRRYGEHSGALSGACVGPQAGTDGDGSGSTSSTTALPSTSGSESTGPAISAGGSTSESSQGMSSGSSTDSSSGGDPGSSSGAPIERVVDGLLVLYTFDEGGGDTVSDVSGVEPSIDLTVMGDGYLWDDTGLSKSNTSGILLAEGSATKILSSCQASNEITLEAWVTPAEAVTAALPARVLTYSLDPSYRNFTLGQTHTVEMEPVPAWVIRLRTTDTTVNGAPYLIHSTEVLLISTHLVFVHAADGSEALYIDGVEVETGTRSGTFDAWDPDTTAYKLALGNEITLDRNWNGTFHLAAIYDRALDADEVQQNFDAGY
jgi:hypothetical protein